ncbi:MAG: alpha/beta hydrolase, partial [Bacteroidetes bacterium]
ARGYRFPGGRVLRPRRLILHSIIGASLHKRWFPWLMRPRLIRRLIQRLVAASWMQPIWERRLFRQREAIPADLRRQFFADYGRCAAFPVFFDLITVDWYRRTRDKIQTEQPVLLWGGKERVVSARYLELWRADLPQATIELVPDWDHFPMLDAPADFSRKFVTLVTE